MDSCKRRKIADDYTLGVLQQEDLLVEIISKLPVKDVIRCRSVSKLWSALTKSTYFMNKHFVNHCHDDDDNPSMILKIDLRKKNIQTELSKCGISLLDEKRDEAISLKLPLPIRNRQTGKTILVECSNGLVCIRFWDVVYHNHEKVAAHKIVVWNPTTNKHRIIPKPADSNLDFLTQAEKEKITQSSPHIGFGFVHHHDMKINTEYILVRFFCTPTNKDVDKHRVTYRALLFVQNTDSWDVVKNETEITTFETGYTKSTVTLNGVVYWKVHLQDQKCGVISFDLRHQVFNLTKIKMLDLKDRLEWGDASLYAYKNSLATYTYNEVDKGNDNILLWTISCSSCTKDDAVKTPLLRLDFLVLPAPRQLKVMLGIWKDQFMFSLVVKSDQVFYEDYNKYINYRKQLLSYDIETHKTQTNILKSEVRICGKSLNYTRTLAVV